MRRREFMALELKDNLRGSFGHRTLALSFAFRVRLGKLSGRATAVHF
jgi:hypothetical protein